MARHVIVASILIHLASQATARAAAPGMPDACKPYGRLYSQVHEDFEFYDLRGGISQQLMRSTVEAFVTPLKRGMHYGFVGGKAYVLSPAHLARMGQAALSRHLVYMNVLLELEATWGAAGLLPDVELVLVPTDVPNQRPVRSFTDEGEQQEEKARQAYAEAARQRQRHHPGAGSSDSAPAPLLPYPNGTYPTFRFSKSYAYPDVLLVPHPDFHLLRYESTVLRAAAALAEQLPWGQRLPQAYARFNMHVPRVRSVEDPTTFRFGSLDQQICGGRRGETCLVRRHFMGQIAAPLAARGNDTAVRQLLDVKHAAGRGEWHAADLHTPHEAWGTARANRGASAAAGASGGRSGSRGRRGRVGGGGGGLRGAAGAGAAAAAAAEQEVYGAGQAAGGAGDTGPSFAAHPELPRYLHEAAQRQLLLHLDGRGTSSLLERLLALGSTVLAEESGYYPFYRLAMEPYKHYVPWWERNPDDLLERLSELRSNPANASAIAAAGQAFALRYLNSQARSCYWLAVLQRLGRTLTYKPRLPDFPHAMPVRRYRDHHVMGTRPLPGQRTLYGQPFEP